MSEIQGDYILLVVLIFSILVLTIKHFKTSSSSKSLTLPPGPTTWSILGSNIPRKLMGSMPFHAALANLAKTYGPLMSVKVNTKCFIVASSPEAAREILKTKDRFLCGRYLREYLPTSELSKASIGWAAECTDEWKLLRSVCRKELFSNNALGNQAKTAQGNIGKLVNFLRNKQGEVFKIADLVYITSSNIVSNALMSRDFISLEETNQIARLKSELGEFVRLATGENVAGFHPMLSKLDLQGKRRKIKDAWKRMEALYEPGITERRSKRMANNSFTNQDLLDALLDVDFSDHHISVLFTELLSASTENISTAVEWLLAELIRNPECMKKIRAEIENASKEDFLKDLNIMELPYLEACVKELLRLHSPAAYTMPHMALETCQVMNYTVPKNAHVLVNLWAIARDPSVWEEPLKFKPERFIGSNFDFNGNNFEYLPFGSGRRMCPAMPMAAKTIPWIVASLVLFFDLSLPIGTDPAELNMDEKSGTTTCMKYQLMLQFRARSA